jgi:hypothetical protein
MGNEISTANQSRPWMGSCPQPVTFLASRRIGTDEEGTVILRRGTTLASSEREEAGNYQRQLRFCLYNAATDGELLRELALLFAPYEGRERSADNDKLRAVAYLSALRGYPQWALQDAVKFWHRGEHSEPVDSRDFAPSPQRLVRLVNIALRPAQEAERKVDGLLRAIVEEPPPKERPDISTLIKRHGDNWGLSTPEDEARKEAEREKHRAQLRRGNEIARRKDFEAHGMEYKAGSLEASPALLSLLGKDNSVEAAE